MIKKIVKILSIVFLIFILLVFYLSIVGIKTDKFNKIITNNILKINKNIILNLNKVNYLLNPFDLTVKVITKNSKISLQNKELEIRKIKTNVSLKSLIKEEFAVDNLQIETKKIKLKDIIAISRTFQNSSKLFILNKITKSGFVTTKINLNFDKQGRIKENYKIEGFIRKANLNILNQLKLQNFNFEFNIEKDNYLLKEISTQLNNIEITSPLIEIKKNKTSFFVKGKLLNNKRKFDIEELKSIFTNLSNNINIKKVEFSSENNFSFNINKDLKFNNLKVESILNLNQLILIQKDLKLMSYFPNFIEEIKLEKHKINIKFNKDKIELKGNGNITLEDKTDNLSYQIIKDNNNFLFDTKINLKNNSLLIDFLDYHKKENSNSLISIKGNLKKNNQVRLDLINLKEMNNKISIKGLDLSEDFRIINIESFDINYENDKKILNKITLNKNDPNFNIKGESFDASKLINKIMDSNEENKSIFDNLNTIINIEIKKNYIDEVNYMNNLNGYINFKNNKINDLKLASIFPNKKKISLSIKANNNSETITKLFTSHPKPLVKRYDFVKGFEEGYLDFYSSKKGGISNSVLIIDNFKVKEVPVFAKLLSLASLQGIADLLTGEGIRFTDLEMIFSNQKGLTKIKEMYAIGPAVSILMNGYIESKKLVSLRGTLVPATTINRSIASIPLLGKILIGDKTGEGVFGVSFKIKGPPKDLKTTVNPIKTLTPRFITRTLEKIKNN